MSSPEIPHDATEFRVDLSLTGMVKCGSLTIPEIRVHKNEVPKETKQLYLILEDTDFHNFPHGTEIIPYEGFSGVLQKSFKVVPLCPPVGPHNYRLTVRALDKHNKIIGYGQTTQQFPE